MSPSVHQASRELMRETLRDGLRAAVDAEDGCGRGSVQCRASAALYVLLGDHPVDRRGRCRSCRRPGALVGRRRRICRVYIAARFYLYQPEQVLLRHLAGELHQDAPPPPGVEGPRRPGTTMLAEPSDADDTEVLPRVAAEPIDALTERPHTPAVPPPLLSSSSGARTGWPVPGHGGAGEPAPRRPRFRRAPSDPQGRAGNEKSMVMARAGAC